MREILFRGKREDSGEWVYGYLNRHPSPVQIGDYNNPWAIHVPPIYPDDNGGVYWIDPTTVGQYTGLTDKNGVKIFEGDILSRDCYDASGRIVKIVYSVELAEFCAQTPSGFGFSMLPPNGKVIGNIHDNPELLMEARNAPTN